MYLHIYLHFINNYFYLSFKFCFFNTFLRHFQENLTLEVITFMFMSIGLVYHMHSKQHYCQQIKTKNNAYTYMGGQT